MNPSLTYPHILAGSYLGIDVAIKEVLPSTDYDVAKYFEREWRLLKYAPPPLLNSHLTIPL
jgi:LIM domain kinase 1